MQQSYYTHHMSSHRSFQIAQKHVIVQLLKLIGSISIIQVDVFLATRIEIAEIEPGTTSSAKQVV